MCGRGWLYVQTVLGRRVCFGDVGDDEFAEVAYLAVDVGDMVLDDVIAQDFYLSEAGGELHGYAYYGDEVDAQPDGDNYGFCTHSRIAPTAFRVVAN